MMTLDEAIAHAEQVADDHERIKKIKAGARKNNTYFLLLYMLDIHNPS